MTQQMKRFYETVTVEPQTEGHAVLLDGRAVKSPGRRLILLPQAAMAAALAAEWQAQRETIDPASMPMMSFASKVTDGLEASPEPARAEIVKYAASDLLCYRAEYPNALIVRQSEQWDPLLQRFAQELDAEFNTATGIVFVEQSANTLAVIKGLVTELHDYDLAAVHQITTLTGSALLAIAQYKGWLQADEVWTLCHLDEDFQAEMWGLDLEAQERREAQQRVHQIATLCLVG